MEPYFLYGILVAGSPAFGLEALLLGIGGKLFSTWKEKTEILIISSGIGLLLTGGSIGITQILSLDSLSPPLLCTMIFTLTFIAGGIISLKNEDGSKEDLPRREDTSEEEIKSMLKDRGLGRLIEEEKKDREN